MPTPEPFARTMAESSLLRALRGCNGTSRTTRRQRRCFRDRIADFVQIRSGRLKRRISTRSQKGAGLVGGFCEADDIGFDAAEVGMSILADAVGDVDDAALLQGQLCGLRGEIPADGADGRSRLA